MESPDPTARPNPPARTRFRCGACGNLTRFDVYESRRIRAFHHFTLGGDLSVEEEEVLVAERERVTCRWCGSSDAIQEIEVDEGVSVEATAESSEERPRER